MCGYMISCPFLRSSVSALEMQYATETAIKAHHSRLKAATAVANQTASCLASNPTILTAIKTTHTATNMLTNNIMTNSTSCYSSHNSCGAIGNSHVGQKRRSKCKVGQASSSTLTFPTSYSSTKVTESSTV